VRRFFAYLGGSFLLALQALREAILPPYEFTLFVAQIHAMGVLSLVLTVVSGLFAGMVVALQGAHELQRFGAILYIGPTVAQSMVREAAPVMTALLVGGKVGAGITAELGAMMVTEQVDALRAIGANHVKFLVVPRLLAGVVVFPLLTSIANVVGMIGGLLVAMFQYRLDHLLYWNTIVEISVGSAEQPRLPDGATLQVEERLDVAAFIGQGQRVLGHAERVAASLDTMLSTLEESKTPEAIAGAARTLERIAASMERGEGAIPWLIQDPASRRLVQDMARAAEAVGALAKEVKEGQGLAHVLIDDPEGAKLVQESRDLVKNLTEASRHLNEISEKIARGEGTLGALLADPILYENLTTLLEGTQRSRLLRSVIQSTLESGRHARKDRRTEEVKKR